MPGLVPGNHALARGAKNVDGRDKPGHDGAREWPTRVNGDRVTTPSTPSCPALCRVSTSLLAALRTWIAGTSPAMTNHGPDVGAKRSFVASPGHARPCAVHPRPCSWR